MVIIHNVLTVRAVIREPLSHYGRILMVGDILMANTAGKPIAMGCPECPTESRNRFLLACFYLSILSLLNVHCITAHHHRSLHHSS